MAGMEKTVPTAKTAIFFGLFIASFTSFLNLAANEVIKLNPNSFPYVLGIYFIFFLICLCFLLNEFGLCPLLRNRNENENENKNEKEKEYLNQVIAVGVLIFAIYPFTKDFLFEYPHHVFEALAAYFYAVFIAIVVFILLKFDLNKK